MTTNTPDGAARENRIVLACPPTNLNTLLEGQDVPPYVPTVEHTLTRCGDCDTDMWIGPKQQAAARRAPGATLVLCMPCAITEMDRRGQPVAAGHLGGGTGRPRLPGHPRQR